PYNDVYEFIKTLNKDEIILLDSTKINYAILNNIPDDVRKIDEFNQTMFMKAQKNKVELENIRNSHIKDGIAFTK
ncbi:aminopeptidase P family N-terminal domain-containing protein, partial [bacterium 210820-DFI.6.52]|nr:aminopeptidase P family N-terminal domain-containing protein [bacterium 210820-DFI.6.52]